MSAFDWMDEALCAQTDPDLFHPEDNNRYATARKLCATCPVRTQCEEHAARVEGDVSRERRHGLWAGHTPYARARQATAEPQEGPEGDDRDSLIRRLAERGGMTPEQIGTAAGCTARTVQRVLARKAAA
ncbi:transcriptional regulator WhiB [Streptomyces chrestomyceticus JCM 4735]|uniref:Transcriptional regulator WhiB n=1 Tax=Streptomyces chrestomyceticus JCM 4735 TaxID=1306181 RepID=A0A7U9Q0M4_9ACTN|nr:WhiB family transcriptional regulator [Streptomyces chrestomyceticus]GCD38015.1 transcriptional regulator WhiB [Streptomyces chrestomyceticus JCM 4735]